MNQYMQNDVMSKEEALQAINQTISDYDRLVSTMDEAEFNQIPYENSWTTGQLLRHVTKSIKGMAKAMAMNGTPTDREPAKRIPELKNVFLDFSKKLNAPEFIVPEPGPYKKEESIKELNAALALFRQNTSNAVLEQKVEGLPLGPITKLEILHFVLYHTQRHLHQLKKINNALNRSVGAGE